MGKPPKLSFIFLLTFLFLSFTPPKKLLVDIPEGYAVIISVPIVDNDLLHKKLLLADTLAFGDLPGTVNDGQLVEAMLLKEGFSSKNIIRLGRDKKEKISVENIINALTTIGNKIAGSGVKNNLFVFYYSGHGHQIPDQPGGDEKKDHKDEVLVANNGYVVDDQINELYKHFFTSTRNIMLADACHAGTFNRILFSGSNRNTLTNLMFSEPICDISSETNVDETINMLYYGSCVDESISHDKNGGYFTRAIDILYKKPAIWKTTNPKDLSCEISIMMQNIKDPGKGKIQYSQLGNLSPQFINNYLFKVK